VYKIDHKPDGGAVIYYDFADGWDSSHLRPKPKRRDGTPEELPDVVAGSFEDRVAGHRVDLIGAIEQGLPPLDFLPASDEMLVRGKRHTVAAPAKDGKSLAMLAHAVDMVLDGAHVIIFDRENGARRSCRRAAWHT
jgi:hypothetical protein